MSEIIVRIEHLRALGYCAKGLRRWFADRGIDYLEVVENGVAADILLATGDAMAIAAVDYAGACGQGGE